MPADSHAHALVLPPPAGFAPLAQHQLAFEPSSFPALVETCKVLFASGLLPKAIVRVEAAVLIAMRGRELGLTLGQAFASIHIIDGKTVLASDLIVARIRKSPACKLWRIEKWTEDECTIVAQRADDEKPTPLTWTMRMAERANLLGKDNWRKYPRSMLRARCAAELARALFPEEALGMYDPDEIGPSVANDNATEPPELVGEIVPPTESPKQTRKASEVAREVVEAMKNAPGVAAMDAIYEQSQKIPFRETMRKEIDLAYESLRASLIEPPPEAS